MEFAETEFDLGELQPDGATLREHLESVERQTGRELPELQGQMECPEEMLYLWEFFQNMSIRRRFNDGVPDPISHTEMLAWASSRGYTLLPWEVDVLDRLEIAHTLHHANRQRKVLAQLQQQAKAK